MLVQIHMIQNHSPSNLNRDDTGSPKEALFGGVLRARISSQCIKRSIRQSRLFQEAMKGHLGKRTRKFPAELRKALLDQGLDPETAEAIVKKACDFGKKPPQSESSEAATDKSSAPGADQEERESGDDTTRQLIFLGAGEVEELGRQLISIYDRDPGAFAAMKADALEKEIKACRPRSVDIALFGRMTTSPAFEDVQAAAQVAHAVSTHKVEHQFDYFTAVDDLKTGADEDKGAAMISDVEFNSATYYKYFAIDYDALVEHLGGDREVAVTAIAAFIKAAALTTPTGKQNAFAAHNPPDAILVEVSKCHIPVNYANAFVQPVRPTAQDDVVALSIKRLSSYAAQVNRAYELKRKAYSLTTREESVAGTEAVSTIGDLVSKVEDELKDAGVV